MTHSIFTLDPNYSTTRLVSTIEPKIEDHPNAKFKTQLFLPEGEDRQGEGGLRTRGYFKHSYEVIDGQWYITDNFGWTAKSILNQIYPNIEYVVVDGSSTDKTLWSTASKLWKRLSMALPNMIY